MSAAGGNSANYEGRVTVFVVLACIVAASGGLLFGYDIGISGAWGFVMYYYRQSIGGVCMHACEFMCEFDLKISSARDGGGEREMMVMGMWNWGAGGVTATCGK